MISFVPVTLVSGGVTEHTRVSLLEHAESITNELHLNLAMDGYLLSELEALFGHENL